MNQTVDNTKQEKKKEETPKQEASSTTELSGGRKFWYVMWFILTVLFCVAAVCLEVELVCMTISFIGVIVAGCALFTTSIGGALFINGIGLLLIGAGIVAIHFANKLRKFVFNNRERWNTYIYNKLGGNK